MEIGDSPYRVNNDVATNDRHPRSQQPLRESDCIQAQKRTRLGRRSHSGLRSGCEVGHLVRAGGHNSHVGIKDLAIGESQSLTDLSDHGFHVKGLTWHGSTGVILGDVQGDPLTSLLLVEGEDGKGSGQVGPRGQGTTMDAANGSPVAMELSRIVVFENDVTDVRVELILNRLSNSISVNLEDVLGVRDFNDSVRVELQLEGLRVVHLVDLLDLEESILDVLDVMLALIVVVGLSVIVNSVMQGVHRLMII